LHALADAVAAIADFPSDDFLDFVATIQLEYRSSCLSRLEMTATAAAACSDDWSAQLNELRRVVRVQSTSRRHFMPLDLDPLDIPHADGADRLREELRAVAHFVDRWCTLWAK
jgi:hypothetical protein